MYASYFMHLFTGMKRVEVTENMTKGKTTSHICSPAQTTYSIMRLKLLCALFTLSVDPHFRIAFKISGNLQ